jgi:hypothetical protein
MWMVGVAEAGAPARSVGVRARDVRWTVIAEKMLVPALKISVLLLF